MTALIVEDGTGVSNANASISLAQFKTYCDDRGKSYSAYTDDQINQAIIRASAFLVSAYTYMGYKTFQRDQTMAFPRAGCWDREGWPIDVNEIPHEFKDACCEVAYAEVVTPGTMNPSVTLADKVKSETVGPISVEYLNASMSASASRPVLMIVEDLLSPFLDTPTDMALLRV